MSETFQSARIHLTLEGGKNNYILPDYTNQYVVRLKHILEDIENEKGKDVDYLYFSSIALSSATLEYSINYLFSLYYFDSQINITKRGSLWKRFSNNDFNERVSYIVPLISDKRYVIDKNSPTIKSISKMISLRNLLLHNSNTVQPLSFETEKIGAWSDGVNWYIPVENIENEYEKHFSLQLKENPMSEITKEKCLEYGRAVLDYYDTIVFPYINQEGLYEHSFVHKKPKKKKH